MVSIKRGDSVTIGSMGNVIGLGFIARQRQRQLQRLDLPPPTTDLDVDGIALGPTSSNIAIGEAGNITGSEGLIGTLSRRRCS